MPARHCCHAWNRGQTILQSCTCDSRCLTLPRDELQLQGQVCSLTCMRLSIPNRKSDSPSRNARKEFMTPQQLANCATLSHSLKSESLDTHPARTCRTPGARCQRSVHPRGCGSCAWGLGACLPCDTWHASRCLLASCSSDAFLI